MINILIVEDKQSEYELLSNYLLQFSQTNNIKFSIKWYINAVDFLENYVTADIIFMDIEMPLLNGMEASVKLRSIDKEVPLIFVTNMAQYAIKGYSVNAVDFLLKPINYARLSSLLKKTLSILCQKNDVEIFIKVSNGVRKIYANSILFVEIIDHLLIYHTEMGQIEVWGKIVDAEKTLPQNQFIKCNRSQIVNLKKIISIENDEIILENSKEKLLISGSKKKAVLNAISKESGR